METLSTVKYTLCGAGVCSRNVLNQTIKATVLGCATSTGVPVAGCRCAVCRGGEPENNRTRSSVLVETGGLNILIDTSTDLRTQALRCGLTRISAVLFTHSHADHTNGIDDLKPFTRFGKEAINCYANPETAANLRDNFGYIFGGANAAEVRPNLRLNEITDDFFLESTKVIPLEIRHGKWNILGYRMGGFAYITDCNGIPPRSLEKLGGLDLLIISALRYKPHPSHFNIEETLECVDAISPGRAVLTHMSCDLDYFELKKTLPENVEPARDGAVFEITDKGVKTVA